MNRLVFLGLFFLSSYGYCQDLISRPSPNTKFPVNNGEDLVNLYTGELNLNVPLFSLVTKEAPVSVSLQYTAGGGVRVQDYASIVGLGWKLNAGGKISRVVRGYPDEAANGYLGPQQWGVHVKSANINNTAYSSDLIADDSGRAKADGEPDMYFIETPFFGGYFTFDENGSAVFLNDTGLKVETFEFNNVLNYTNSSFKITDQSGNQYFFGSNDKKEHSQFSEFNLFSFPRKNEYSYVTSWYLEKIVFASGQEVVDFEYSDFNPQPFDVKIPLPLTSVSRRLNTNENYLQFSASKTIVNISGFVPNYNEVSLTSKVRSLYLQKIKSTYGEILFSYTQSREDAGAPSLSSVSLYSILKTQKTHLKTYNFVYSYFGQNTSDNKLSKRLCLDRITYILGTSSPVQTNKYFDFSYNKKKNLPSRNSNQFDYFGFYTKTDTSKFGNTVNPIDYINSREPLFLDYTSANVLESFSNESDVTTSVKYELKTVGDIDNSYDEVNRFQFANGLRVKEVNVFSSNTTFQTKFQYEFFEKISPNSSLTNFRSFGVVSDPYFKKIWTYMTDAFDSNIIWVKYESHSESNMMEALTPKVGYSKVKVIYPDQTSKIVEFTNFNDFPDVYQVMKDSPWSSFLSEGGSRAFTPVSKVQKRGLPLKVYHYDDQDNLIRSLENDYSTIGSVSKSSYGLMSKRIGMSASNANNNSNRCFSHTFYSLYWNEIENYKLTKTTEKVYDNSLNNYIQTEQELAYNNSPYTWQTKSVTSTGADGVQQKATSYYPNELANIPLLETNELWNLQQMTSNNIFAPVVHQEVEIKGNKVNADHTFYVYPFKVGAQSKYLYKNGVATKIAESVIDYKEGNPVLVENESKERVSTGYQYDLPVVKIINASSVGSPSNSNKYHEFYYEGFEHYASSFSYAGKGAMLNMPDFFEVPFIKPNNRTYLIDYRYLDISLGKWIYAKHEYTNGMQIGSIGGSLDEIRVYPSDSQITTFTRSLINGVTSETNTLGHTIFYEYDDQNRLILMRDQDKNIVKLYEYNDKRKSLPNVAFVSLAYMASINGQGTILCESTDKDEYYFINVNNVIAPPIVIGTILYQKDGTAAPNGYYSRGSGIAEITGGAGKVSQIYNCHDYFYTIGF